MSQQIKNAMNTMNLDQVCELLIEKLDNDAGREEGEDEVWEAKRYAALSAIAALRQHAGI